MMYPSLGIDYKTEDSIVSKDEMAIVSTGGMKNWELWVPDGKDIPSVGQLMMAFFLLSNRADIDEKARRFIVGLLEWFDALQQVIKANPEYQQELEKVHNADN